jgi:hypothetical protein
LKLWKRRTRREREKARWAEACEKERLRGAAEVERIRAEGKARYMAVVRSIEARCVAEFETHMAEISAKKESASGEARALEARLRELRSAVSAARAERTRLEAESGRLRQAASVEAEGKRARLADLQAHLRRAWSDGSVPPATMVTMRRPPGSRAR